MQQPVRVAVVNSNHNKAPGETVGTTVTAEAIGGVEADIAESVLKSKKTKKAEIPPSSRVERSRRVLTRRLRSDRD